MADKKAEIIALTGLMGAGKTSIGAALSKKLGIALLDTDKLIEAEQGCTIADIFKNRGEQAFRDIEAQTVKAITGRQQPCVLSLGGGAITNPATLAILKAETTLVYLKASPQKLMRNLSTHENQLKKRPLLLGDNPESILQELLDKRKSCYEQAHIILDCENLDVNEAAQKIYQSIKEVAV